VARQAILNASASNVQVAVDTKHHLIVTHDVTNVGSDRSQRASVAKQTKAQRRRRRDGSLRGFS
jgi:hypothetical protein